MFHDLLERVRAEASGERALDHVRALARFHRIQASPGYDAAAAWLIARLEALGLEVEVEHAPGDGVTRRLGQLMPEGWACERATADLLDGARRERLSDFEAAPLSIVQRSAPARGRFPIVAVKEGAAARDYEGVDVRGRVVLTSAPPQAAHVLAVVERGAAGLLCDGRRLFPPVRDRFDDPGSLPYLSFWWAGDEPRGWGLTLAPRDGARLRERLAAGARLELDVTIETRRFVTRIPLVSARVPGSGAEEVLVLSHLCHPQPGANDNASGAAAALEAARVLAALRARTEVAPARSVRFLWMPEFTGTFAWFGADPARAGRTTAAVNLDMVGERQDLCGSTMLIEHPPCFAASFAEHLLGRIRRAALDWVRSYSGPGHFALTRTAEVPYGGGSDHAVLVDPGLGVPCPMLIQWPDRFYHSSLDTPDKCDPASLALAVRCAATYAGFLASAGSAEARWLLESTARDARRRVLAALDEADAGRALARETIRARAALDSLGRLGVGGGAIAAAREAVESFAAREAPGALPPAVSGDGAGEDRPRRLLAACLGGPRHLLPNHHTLTADERAAWDALEARSGEAPQAFEVAWAACDGRRTMDEIVEIVRIETGWSDPGAIAAFFTWTGRLGLSAGPSPTSGKEEPCRSSAPVTDTP